MTEMEKMQSGLPYCYINEEMDIAKRKAQNLVYEYNKTKPSEEERRREILKELLGTSTDMVYIEPAFHCDYGVNIHFKGMAFINYNCVMLDTAPIHIGEFAFIGPGTCFGCPTHSLNAKERRGGIGCSNKIVLEDNVWIGANCTILGGVTIGEGSVIGAGSVVTKDIPSGVVAVGNPCKVLRKVTEADKMLKD